MPDAGKNTFDGFVILTSWPSTSRVVASVGTLGVLFSSWGSLARVPRTVSVFARGSVDRRLLPQVVILWVQHRLRRLVNRHAAVVGRWLLLLVGHVGPPIAGSEDRGRSLSDTGCWWRALRSERTRCSRTRR